MGRPLRQQKRGKGSLTYRTPSHRYPGKISYTIKHGEKAEGKIVDIFNAPGRTAPMIKVRINDKIHLMLAPSGVSTDSSVSFTDNEKQAKTGNVLPLGKINEGIDVFNIEKYPGDGGRFCRTAGSSAIIVRRGEKTCDLLLSSKKIKTLSAICRATVGKVAGGGIGTQPLAKAGKNFHKMKSRGKVYPHVKGVCMNAVDHPFGGSNMGRKKTISGNAPPGQKVGNIRAHSMGKKRARKGK